MIFRTIENGSRGWKSLGYTTTWGYGWDFILDAAQALIDVDWKTGLDKVTWSPLANTEPVDVTDKVKQAGGRLRDVKENKSHVLDNYMNSIEIKAYCTDTERRVRAEYK